MLLSLARAPPSAPDVPKFPCSFAKLWLPWSWPSVPLCPCTILPHTPVCSLPAFPHGSKRSTTPQAALALPPRRLSRDQTQLTFARMFARCSSQLIAWDRNVIKAFLASPRAALTFSRRQIFSPCCHNPPCFPQLLALSLSSCWRSGQAHVGRS